MRDPDLFINVPSSLEMWVLDTADSIPDGSQVSYTHINGIRIAWRLRVNEKHAGRSTQRENEEFARPGGGRELLS